MFHISGIYRYCRSEEESNLCLNLCNPILVKGRKAKNIDVSRGFSQDLDLFNLDQKLAFVSGITKYFMYLCSVHHMVHAWL